jgi:RND family efflux transporter MFP subunit
MDHQGVIVKLSKSKPYTVISIIAKARGSNPENGSPRALWALAMMVFRVSPLIFSLCAFLSSGCRQEETNKQEPIRPVKVFNITEPEEFFQRSFPGKVEASEKADLAFLVDGKIIEFPVKKGDRVKQGQMIAKLDPKDFEIALQKATSQVELAKIQLDRSAELLKQGFAPQSRYDKDKTDYDVAVANRDTAQQNFDYSELRAPFDGEVAERYVENYQTVRVKEPVVALHNRDSIDIVIQVPESLAIRAQKGKNSDIVAEFDSALGNRYPVTLKELSSKPDPNTQTYKVTLTMGAPKDLNILPGMTATIFLKLKVSEGDQKGQYKIPVTAVFSDEHKNSYVWVIEPNTDIIKKQPVTVAALEKESAVITSGLSPGMMIIAAGAKVLREGMKVRPLAKVENQQ